MKTRILVAAAASCALFATNAHAQGRRPTPTPTPATSGSPWTDPGTGSTTTTGATTGSGMAAMTAAPAAQGEIAYRPEGKSIGIGAGWSLPADLGTPNRVSARFRMDSGLAIEPSVGVGINTASGKVATTKTSSTGFDLTAGADIRKPFWTRHQAEAIFIIGGELGVGSTSSKDAAGGKTTATAFGLAAGYGLGVEFFPRSHWSISFDATNPILSFTNFSGKDPAGVKTTNTGIFIGAVWDPSVRLMTHLYY